MRTVILSIVLLFTITPCINAQRHCDVAIQALYGPFDSTTFGCNNHIKSGYVFINKGPDNIYATDTFFFRDPNADSSGPVYIFRPTGPLQTPGTGVAVNVAVGDTIFNYQWTDSLSRILQLRKIDSPYTIVYAPNNGADGFIPNGTYYYPIEFLGFKDETKVIDTVRKNDAAWPVVIINCDPTNLHDVKHHRIALTVYPNPANNSIYFKYNFLKSSKVSVRILDLTGRTFKAVDFGKVTQGTQQFEIDINKLSAGTYILEYTTEEDKGIAKFTKN
jgi:hypothetical protein